MSSDRLTALDTSFLHLEDAASHMHVASVMLFEGSPPPYDDLLDAIERRLHLVPRYRQRLAFVPLAAGPPEVGRRPAPEPALPRARDRAAGTRRRGAAQGARRSRVRAAARSRQAAVGDLARGWARGRPLRAALEDPPLPRRRHLRRRHHLGALRHLARARRADRPGRPLAAAADAVERAAARRGAGRARHDPGGGGPLRARGLPRPAPHPVRASATPPSASARWPGRASTPPRRAPTTSRSARTGASPGCAPTWARSRRSRTSSAGPSTTSCCRPSPARSASTCAGAGRTPTGSS